MPTAFHTRRRVEWADTDKAGIVHFARFFVFIEAAEHEFWRSLGLSVYTEINGDIISWPRLTTACEYLCPVSFEDELDIHLQITKIGEKSLSYTCDFHCEGEPIARGELKIVCCICNPGEKIRAVAIPASIAAKLQG